MSGGHDPRDAAAEQAASQLSGSVQEYAYKTEALNREQRRLVAARNAAIQLAARTLSKREICQITGLSEERVRQITRGSPVSWPRRVTVRRLGADVQ